MRAYLALLFCFLCSACAHSGQTVAINDNQSINVGPTQAAAYGTSAGSVYSQEVRTTGRAINDLNAYHVFKQTAPDLFAVRAGAPVVSLEMVQAVNENVNHSISYQNDPPGVEIWHVMPTGGEGNCHDYAVTKLSKMIAAGAPRSALRLTVASVKATGEWHLMLAVDVPGRGTFFMDSNRENVLTAAEARDLYTLWFMENPATQRLELVA